MTLGSLFDGIGVFPLAAQKNGITPLWASEISASGISITKRHFPQMHHLGDITALHGGTVPPVDIITFGSPCQDLSLSGNRAGLAGRKSNLFFEAIRIIEEMREATDGIYPTFAVWENVVGALSSNDRMDFNAVLSAFTDTQIPMPDSGRWAGAGMVRGHCPDIAWRVLDSRYFGVAQKRRRIFLVADYRGQRAGKVLFEPESQHQILPVGTAGRISAAPGTGKSPTAAGWTPCEIHALQNRKLRGAAISKDRSQFYGGFGYPNDALPTLLTGDSQVIFLHYPDNPEKDHVRFLTPTEYERLMGLPEGWTELGHDDKLISDTARYFGLGNSIVVPCAELIMQGIRNILEETI
ncbi:DNA cytosine methyltransferase [Ruminococcaceae bacterium OttesenSCG-928-A16]|nr:DNA cytosine methyltransferase [Ruminococcaceae bacterium OttesenSCG-928-A16]